ncbi:MAG: hypothetical protein ACW967_03390 [Candidatus Hodarchaeales archaeon]|jgi:hypothetical protein
MPIIQFSLFENKNLVLVLRLIVGLTWFGTAVRRILIPNFEERITDMSEGGTLIPEALMKILVENWFLIFLIVLSIEGIVSFSLLSGTLARGGALLATINGFAIGLSGIGLGIVDLLIPWFFAFLSLILFLFTHPGKYIGLDERLSEKKLPQVIKIWI